MGGMPSNPVTNTDTPSSRKSQSSDWGFLRLNLRSVHSRADMLWSKNSSAVRTAPGSAAAAAAHPGSPPASATATRPSPPQNTPPPRSASAGATGNSGSPSAAPRQAGAKRAPEAAHTASGMA